LADVVVAGGADACVSPITMAAFARMGALSRNDDPTAASRPFDTDRDGFVMGEGAAFLVLEPLERALARGAHIHGELMGYGATCDAHHITAPLSDGSGAIACVQLALADAGLDAAAVGHVNAHGTSTPHNDAAEAEAIAKVFGSPGPPVTSIKGVTGHSLGAAGALEAVAVVQSMLHGLIPPTAGYGEPDPELATIDIVTETRPWTPGPTLSNSFGFGGHNGCLVIGPA